MPYLYVISSYRHDLEPGPPILHMLRKSIRVGQQPSPVVPLPTIARSLSPHLKASQAPVAVAVLALVRIG